MYIVNVKIFNLSLHSTHVCQQNNASYFMTEMSFMSYRATLSCHSLVPGKATASRPQRKSVSTASDINVVVAKLHGVRFDSPALTDDGPAPQ